MRLRRISMPFHFRIRKYGRMESLIWNRLQYFSTGEDKGKEKYIPEAEIKFSKEGKYEFYFARPVTHQIKYAVLLPSPLIPVAFYFILNSIMHKAWLKAILFSIPTYLLCGSILQVVRNSSQFIVKMDLLENGEEVQIHLGNLKKDSKMCKIKDFKQCDEETFKSYVLISKNMSAEYFPIYIESQLYFIDRNAQIYDHNLWKAITNGTEVGVNLLVEDETEESAPNTKTEEAKKVIDI